MAELRADLIVKGRIATLAGETGFGWVDALAIGGGRVLAAGSESEIEAFARPRMRRLELGRGQVALPGLTDAHLHLVDAAQAATELQLGPDASLDTALALIGTWDRDRRAQGDRDGWLLGRGWSFDGFGGWPLVAGLELVAPGRPIALWAHDHHARWFSPAAMHLAGIDAATPDPAGGTLLRDDAGRPTGVALEHAARLVEPAIPAPDPEALAVAVEAYARRLLRLGIVAVHDPGEVAPEPRLARGPRLYARLAGEGRLPLRVHASVRAEQLERAIELGLRSGQPTTVVAADGDPLGGQPYARAHVGWLKLFGDGSLGSRTAWLLEPYADTGLAGLPLTDPAELTHLVRLAAGAGLATQIHAIGDRAARTALDAFAAVPDVRRLPLAPRVEHAQLVSAIDTRRFGRLGVAASVQPSHLAGDGPAAGLAWPDRLADAYRWRSFVAGGAALAFGTDAPVESPDPWPGIALAVTRRPSPTAARFPGAEGLTMERAIRASILDPAIIAGEAGIRGRLTAGHLADLVVLPAAALDEPVRPAGALATARPLLTLLDGRESWRDASFDR
ncbi:MAG TPA: amidohydrolase [Candidatus Limnocylindrales bacterium]|nr:amidohydrolase [Candidatus Limnocylindrales bacterium]